MPIREITVTEMKRISNAFELIEKFSRDHVEDSIEEAGLLNDPYALELHYAFNRDRPLFFYPIDNDWYGFMDGALARHSGELRRGLGIAPRLLE